MTDAFLDKLKEDTKEEVIIPSAVPSSKDVIERTMMQKTVFRIYPNGQTFIVKEQCMTWFTEQRQVYKKKEKKMAQPIKAIEMKKEESY